MLWIYETTNNETLWNNIFDNLNRYNGVFDTISLCPYRILANGTFGYQTSHGAEGAIMESKQPIIHQFGYKLLPLIDCHDGVEAMRELIYSVEKRRDFINQAIDKSLEYELYGYNLDIEIVSDTADAIPYTDFINEFATELHKYNKILTADIATCNNNSMFMGMNCSLYNNSLIDKVITMQTYETNIAQFISDVTISSNLLGNKFVCGLQMRNQYNPTFGEELDYLKINNLKNISLWVNIPPNKNYWHDIIKF